MKQPFTTFAAILLSLCVASCDSSAGAGCLATEERIALDADSSQHLTEKHREMLICAGWLDYVERHVCTIEYVDRVTSETDGTEVVGRAVCSDATIIVARQWMDKPIGPFEATVTIVHEAAHLADACEHGEEPALEAEQAYINDFDGRACANLITREGR